ncbi:MAG: HEPN domain-containing protein [Clostridiales bacterium]|jgi:HEPN domain-containing protein|nr:HEPN domain-containing protein [Clostridiales bacterium]
MSDKVKYWLDTADEDLTVAKYLLTGKKYLHAGFFMHLIVEKTLKAVVARVTSEMPPKIHDLAILAERAGLKDDLTDVQLQLFKALNPLQIEARYPEYKERMAATLTHKK